LYEKNHYISEVLEPSQSSGLVVNECMMDDSTSVDSEMAEFHMQF
jgi:hypothetical protein